MWYLLYFTKRRKTREKEEGIFAVSAEKEEGGMEDP
jgi:hypothetical protein